MSSIKIFIIGLAVLALISIPALMITSPDVTLRVIGAALFIAMGHPVGLSFMEGWEEE